MTKPKWIWSAVALAACLPGVAHALNEREGGTWPWKLKLHGWHDRELAEMQGRGWCLNVGPAGIRAQITCEHPDYWTVKKAGPEFADKIQKTFK